MGTTSVQLSQIIKKLNRASLEYVLFETLLREAAEQGETPILERVNKVLAMQEQEGGASPSAARAPGGDASSSTEASTPAPSSPAKNEPPAPAATPGKDKATWDELSLAEKEAATAIGYNQLGWDEGIPPETCSKRWATLADAERTAASLLGYSGAEWDAELEEEESAAGGEAHADTASSAAEGEPNGVQRAEEIPAPSAAAPASAPSASPSAADVTPGKDKATWEELSPREKAAATAIGYNQLGWDEGIPPETCSKRWATLADAERTAASLLGYSGAEWDAELEAELEGEQGAGAGGAEEEVAAEQLPDALADLGQEMGSMSLGTPAAPSTPAAPAAPAAPVRASSAPAPTKAAGLGGPEPARASSAPAVLGKDKEEWASLTAEEQRAATALGFERGMWDEGVAPEKCSHPWAALSEQDRRDAAVLGYAAASWDAEIEGEVGGEVDGEVEGEVGGEVDGAPPAAPAALARVSPNAMAAATRLAAPPPKTPPKPAAPPKPPKPTAAKPAQQSAAGGGSGGGGGGSPQEKGKELGKDKEWSRLRAHEKQAAAALGYTGDSWDAGLEPDAMGRRWAALSAAERKAAGVLGYRERAWEAELDAQGAHDGGKPPQKPKPAKKGAASPPKGVAPPAAAAQRALSPNISPSTAEQHAAGGAVFGCTWKTKDECMSRQLLGLPAGKQHTAMIERITPRKTALFLFNYSKREMYGVFESQEPGGMNLVPEAWRDAGGFRSDKAGADASPFPTQIRFKTVFNFLPLPERYFKHIMDYTPNSNRFKFELTPQQVADLLNAFKAHDAERPAKA